MSGCYWQVQNQNVYIVIVAGTTQLQAVSNQYITHKNINDLLEWQFCKFNVLNLPNDSCRKKKVVFFFLGGVGLRPFSISTQVVLGSIMFLGFVARYFVLSFLSIVMNQEHLKGISVQFWTWQEWADSFDNSNEGPCMFFVNSCANHDINGQVVTFYCQNVIFFLFLSNKEPSLTFIQQRS